MYAKKYIAAAALLTLAGVVSANDLLPFSEADHFVSSKTRAEVKAEARQAVQLGQITLQGDVMPLEQFSPATTIAQHRSEVLPAAEQRTDSAQSSDSVKNVHGNVDHAAGS